VPDCGSTQLENALEMPSAAVHEPALARLRHADGG
jgi:hypothetical protein